MSNRIRLSGYRLALLPAALSLAVMTMSAHASESWVSTNTHAAIQKNAVAKTSTLIMKGHPSVAANQIMPLEQSKPLHIVINLNQRNAEQFKTFLHDVQQPGNAKYQKFLTPAQFKAQYAPTDAQVKAVVEYLERSGFTHIEVAPNNLLVSADGSAMSANAAFNTSMQTFSFQGKQHFANAADVMVPQSLSGIVHSVLGLQDVVTAHVMSHINSNSVAAPQATASQVTHSPTDFPTIYDVGTTASASTTTVGIIGWYDMAPTIADLNTFTKNAGLATVSTEMVKTGGSTATYQTPDINTQAEWNLDSQTIIGTSGGVKALKFYTAPSATLGDITAAYNKAVTDNVATVINVSLGVDETAANNAGSQAADDKIFATAVAQGQTFSIASGDAGVYQWSSDGTGIGYVADSSGTVQIDLTHYSVSEPAASPNVITVGGTALSTTNTTTWAGETVWNEGLSAISSTDSNQRIWATGGGVSSFEDAPAWQTKALGTTVTKRQVPDVAFDAAQASGAKILIQGNTYGVGGTSLASPIFVGIWARIESANKNSLGLPTQNMYTYFPKDSAPLHDVTSGNNGYSGNGYSAGVGYDNATGWGSLDISKFGAYVTKYWGGATPPPSGPAANFTDKVNGLAVAFTNSSTDTGGTISSYAWNFGDSSSSTAASPSHTYAKAGTYTVTLTVTDSKGATNTKTASVVVTSNGGVFSNSTPVNIDDNATITSNISVSGQSGNASSTLKVSANITHNWSGDLEIDLIAPDGSTYVLQQPDYNDDGNINTTWTVNASSNVANGTWQLQVIDNDSWYSGDQGTLNSWKLSF
ncbi:protease pro-enzyme activation domain-containing protein [Dyella silvatica]|uniref:protease pro-enzyme activation domain-containing protein n=1 Tax=Dyella silvatica TaxID=2992128 RepID=UPI002254B9F3|nr:protease pro-enzyme activation domain-containing protein [Dyella silvatica]